MKILNNSIFLLMFGSFCSCVSLNSHQTGKTLGKNNEDYFTNLSFGKINNRQYSPFQDSSSFYILEGGWVYGIREKIDIGVKANTSFFIVGTGKYQFLGNKKSLFASSIGINLGLTPPSVLLLVINYSGSLSLINSIHLKDDLAITFSPKYIYLGFTNFSKEFGFTRESHIVGYSSGIIIGKKHQFSFEISQYTSNEKFTFSQQPQISFGYIKKINKNR